MQDARPEVQSGDQHRNMSSASRRMIFMWVLREYLSVNGSSPTQPARQNERGMFSSPASSAHMWGACGVGGLVMLFHDVGLVRGPGVLGENGGRVNGYGM